MNRLYPPASLLLKVSQQALQQAETERRAGSPARLAQQADSLEFLEQLAESDTPEIASRAALMVALYFTGETK